MRRNLILLALLCLALAWAVCGGALAEDDSAYIVEFFWDTTAPVYTMRGGSTVALSEILSAAGVSGEVTDVTFDRNQYFSASKEAGEWRVTTLKFFSDNLYMDVKIGKDLYSFHLTCTRILPGSGTAEDPYRIGSADDWMTFSDIIQHHYALYGDKCYELTQDISVNWTYSPAQERDARIAGFEGTFDGKGHTLTFNYSGSIDQIAPFYYIQNATIKNLRVAGTIHVSNNHSFAAGIASSSAGHSTIENCISAITISGNGFGHGGLVGRVKDENWLTIRNCVFSGSMAGSMTGNCGGFVGLNQGSVFINDCLCAPTSIGIGDNLFYTFVPDSTIGDHTLTRVYRTWNGAYSAFNQGTRAYTAMPDSILTKMITLADGQMYYVDGGAAITGRTTVYKPISGTVGIPYAVTFDGNTLTKGTDYTETFTNSSGAVVSSPVAATGTYTLTVTGTGSYAGSLSRAFTVLNKTVTSYLDASGAAQRGEAAPVDLESNTLTAGWYAVFDDITFSDRLIVSGDVHMILCDGCTLTAAKGIGVADDNSLTLYAQSTGENMGALIATGAESSAGIGGYLEKRPFTAYAYLPFGDITINGGVIDATCDTDGDGAGIGGCGGEETKTITINGGIITATGAIGIGGGLFGGKLQKGGSIALGWNSGNTRINVSGHYRGYNGAVTYNRHFVLEGTSTEPTSGSLNSNDSQYRYATLVPAATVTMDSSMVGGSIDAGGALHEVGSTVTLTPRPASGFELDTLTVTKTGDSSTTVAVSDENTFTMPAYDVTVSATFTTSSGDFTVSSDGNVYTIHNAAGWNIFCDAVNGGTDFSGTTVKLGASISVSTMAGDSNHRFSGNFDGQGHTINITYNSTEEDTAPFRYGYGCNIMNLHVKGNITTNQRKAAGLIAIIKGTVNIGNCRSSVVIESSLNRSACHGGFVGNIYSDTNLTIEGCVFDGKIINSSGTSTGCGGFVGYKNSRATLTITNSLYIPAALDTNENEITNNSSTFACSWTMPDDANCYYTRTLGTAQGTQARSVTAGEDVTVGFGTPTQTYSVSGITLYRKGLAYGGTFYAGENETVSLTLGYTGTPASGTAFSGYTASGGTLGGTGDPYYTLKMPGADVTISAAFSQLHAVTVQNGRTNDSTAAENAVVTITANEAPDGMLFDRWTSSVDGVTFADATSVTTTFTMPAEAVTVTATFAPDPAHFSVNDAGTEYTIHTAAGWNAFCECLNDNATYNRFSDKTVKLGANITVTRMAGSSGHDFCGTFDGGGKTLTFNYGGADSYKNEQYIAPFRYVSNVDSVSATIRNLRVAGDIYTSAKYAAGFISRLWGTVNIQNCRSSVVIHSSVSSDGTHGGFVAENSALLNITGCVFDGKLLTRGGTTTTSCGGFVGYGGTKVNISDSLYAPAALGQGETEVLASESGTFNRTASNLNNCYYTRALGTAQGKAARSVTAGEYVTVSAVALTGDATTYSVSGITAYSGGGLSHGGSLYYGDGDVVRLTLSGNREGYALTGYTASAGTLNDTTLTMPDEDVTISATFTQSGPAIKGHVLQLNGVLGLKFYVALPEDFDPDGSRMTFTINGSTQTVSFSESRMEYGYYYFPCQVKSFQMADEITAAYIWGDEADQHVSETYSIQQYLATFTGTGYSTEVVELAHAIQNYGHYVQPYLAKANHWTVGTDHAEMPKYSNVATNVNASAYALDIPVKAGIVENSTYSLSLDANTALNVYLTLNDDSVTALTAQIDDRTPYTISRRSDGTFRITCGGIEGNNLGKFYLFTVKNGDETIFQANISALSFVNTVLNKTTHTDDTEVDAVCALYWYAQAADAYAKSLTN